MKEIQPTDEMKQAATLLRQGPLIYVYLDGQAIRAETEFGEDPYVWRHATTNTKAHWQLMCFSAGRN